MNTVAMEWGVVVGIWTNCLGGRPKNRVLITGKDKRWPVHENIQTDWGHPASCSVDAGSCLPGGKAAGL
jgi:hypothetical protein